MVEEQTKKFLQPDLSRDVDVDVDVDVDADIDVDVDVDVDDVDDDEDGKRTPPTDPSHPQTGGCWQLKRLLAQTPPFASCLSQLSKIAFVSILKLFGCFHLPRFSQKYLKLLSHFWVAVVPNAIVRQATEEQMGQSNC